MKKNLSRLILLVSSVFFLNSSFAQGTLEMTLDGSNNNALGANVNPVVVQFLSDATNNVLPSGNPATVPPTVFANYTPTLTTTISFRAQTRSTTLTNTSTVVPGMTFGGRTTASQGGTTSPTNPQVIGTTQVYNVFGDAINVPKPKNGMYISSPSASPVSPTDIDGNPVGAAAKGLDVENNSGATGPSGLDANFGVALYNTVEPLFDINADKAGRFYYGELVIRFSRPVANPVIHVGGLGGSYNYQPLSGGPRLISYFTTELELVNTDLTSTFMAGNPFFNVSGNNILNSSATPNGGSYEDGSTSFGFTNYGAASGSVRLTGTVQEVVYRVYVRGSAASDFNFSKTRADISSPANRDPFNGDLWYLAVSLEKPTQQLSGNVFEDKDGLTDNDINKSAGVANPTTNLGGSLFAKLFSGTTLVATTPIGADGSYLFDNLATGTYTVQLTDNPGLPGASLPAGWVNTGEFVGNTAGNDFNVNGISIPVTVGSTDIKTEVNFGIERLPESVDKSKFINKPLLRDIYTLNGPAFPVLEGSDPEDQPVSGILTGKSVRFTTLPPPVSVVNGLTPAILLYEFTPGVNTQITLGQTITNFDPAKLKIQFTNNPANTGTTEFTYAYVDAAGKQDPTPATYKLLWPDNGPLPITLSDFDLTRNNCTANLNWKTISENGADKFEIEVSTSQNVSFTKFNSVRATGALAATTLYGTSYAMQSGVVYFFRLKMINADGTFKYSDVISTSCTDTKSNITISPNPTADFINIKGLAKGKNTIMIYAADGKLINSLTSKDALQRVALTTLAPGTYIVRIIDEKGNSTSERIVKN
jgi:Secretion system C-terminal sorting domain